jgi:hypothetical protein
VSAPSPAEPPDQAGLAVRLFTSASHFITRDEMDSTHPAVRPRTPAWRPVLFSASVAPAAPPPGPLRSGQRRDQQLRRVPVTAQLQDPSGEVISSSRRCCRSGRVPGGGLASPLVSWLWPLIDQPQQKVYRHPGQQQPGRRTGGAAACPRCSTPGRAIPAPT